MQVYKRQGGAVLFTALMFLIVVTLIALASIRSGVLELRMSLNDEIRVNAFQQAQSFVDWLVATPAATPVTGTATFSRCTEDTTVGPNESFSCAGLVGTVDATILQQLGLADADLRDRVSDVNGNGGEFSAVVQRTGSEDARCPRSIGSTAVGTGCAPFRIRVLYDCTDCPPEVGGGRVEIRQGVLVFVATGDRNF